MAPLVAAGHHLPISITVLDQEGMDFLFGLDNLKRHQVRRRGMGGSGFTCVRLDDCKRAHIILRAPPCLTRAQCCIDLKANALRFGSTEAEIPFLPEHEVPRHQHQLAGEDAASGEAGHRRGIGKICSHLVSPGKAPHLIVFTRSPATDRFAGRTAATAPPSTAPAPTNQPPSQAAPPATNAQLEEKVSKLMGLGFDRNQCLVALRVANGNEELAASLLFSM